MACSTASRTSTLASWKAARRGYRSSSTASNARWGTADWSCRTTRRTTSAEARCTSAAEGNEKALSYAIERVGPEPFMFASDFPHEITIENCMEEIDEILEREDIKEEHQMLILRENARNMYGEP